MSKTFGMSANRGAAGEPSNEYDSLRGDVPRSGVVIDYTVNGDYVARYASSGKFASSSLMKVSNEESRTRTNSGGLSQMWNLLELKGHRPRVHRGSAFPRINIVDLFCGCGGLSLGIKRAADAIGLRTVFLLAVDVAEPALRVYVKNLRPLRQARQNVETLVDYSTRIDGDGLDPDMQSLSVDERLASIGGDVDLLVAGPPCEGNSNFNNRTRRFDSRNRLYIDAVVAGISVGARVIVIENVPMVKRSRQSVVSRSIRLLRQAGYHDRQFTLSSADFGTPQVRSRHFLVASRSKPSWTMDDFEVLRVPAPPTIDVLDDLLCVERVTAFDQPSLLSPQNESRVKFLIEKDKYDLPDDERPDCHRLKKHSYPSVYGRMRPNQPASTITTGFLSPGRGRFTHPLQPRSLTPHEGARLQGFGDDFDWLQETETLTRGDYANLIGSAVPPQLGYVIGMCAMSLL